MKRITVFSLVFFGLLLLSIRCDSPEKNDIVFDARSLIGQSPQGVEQVLGKPDSTYQRSLFGKRYFIQYYHQYGIEVRHLQGKIVNVIINDPYPLEFAPQTITKFGINYVEPTEYDSLAMIVWKNIDGFKVINFYLRGVKKPDSVKHSYHIFFNMDTTSQK